MHKQAQLTIELLASDASAAPAEFCIFQPGVNRTTKGAFLFSDKSRVAVMASVEDYGNQFCIDYGHAMFVPKPGTDPADAYKAAGWFKPAVRNGALWATEVTWTPKAAAAIAAREYRYVSPAFHHGPDGEVEELINVGLTNIPATKQMTPLVASQTQSEPVPMEKLIALLALTSKATEADIAVEVSALKSTHVALLAVTGKGSQSEALGVIAAWKAGAEQTEALSARLASMELASRKAEVTALITAAVKEGKVAPAQVASLSQVGDRDPEWLKAFLGASVAVLPKATREPASATAVATLSQDEMKMAKLFGHKPEDVAALKAKIGAVPVQNNEAEA